MAMNTVIRTNILAINSHRNLGLVSNQQARSSQRLSSGYRINTAADDAAGLAISEKMRAQIRGLDQASRNANDAISLVQTACGGMQEIDNMIQRIRELVVYASNDHLDQVGRGDVQGDRRKIQDEIDQLMEEIDSLSSRVEFNRKRLIDGSFSSVGRIGITDRANVASANNQFTTAKINFNDAINSAIANINRAIDFATRDTVDGTGIFGLSAHAGNMTPPQLASAHAVRESAIRDLRNLERALLDMQADVHRAGTRITSAFWSVLWGTHINNVNALSSRVNGLHGSIHGASRVAFSATLRIISAAVNTVSATGNGPGVSGPAAHMSLVSAAVRVVEVRTAAISATIPGHMLHFQVGANANQALRLNIGAVNTFALGLGAGLGSNGSLIDIMQLTGADTTGLINRLDEAATIVATERSRMGAVQNRLEFTGNSLLISSENLQAAESRIRNTDMGAEMMRLTQANILQQAAISMLAQGNMAPQAILQLLQ